MVGVMTIPDIDWRIEVIRKIYISLIKDQTNPIKLILVYFKGPSSLTEHVGRPEGYINIDMSKQ